MEQKNWRTHNESFWFEKSKLMTGKTQNVINHFFESFIESFNATFHCQPHQGMERDCSLIMFNTLNATQSGKQQQSTSEVRKPFISLDIENSNQITKNFRIRIDFCFHGCCWHCDGWDEGRRRKSEVKYHLNHIMSWEVSEVNHRVEVDGEIN